MTSGRCLDCRAEFREPTFSEGPKVWDDGLQAVVRFRLAWYQCPACLSRNIEPIPS